VGGLSLPAVYALEVSGSNLYAGGPFVTAGGITAKYIAKWDGSSWSALGSGVNNNVAALAVSGGNLYAGGTFTMAGGNPASYVAKWDGSGWSALGSGTSYYPVWALAVSGGDLYAGGRFTAAGASSANNIAKWDGVDWTPLGSGLSSTVSALTVLNNNLYVGGSFATAGANGSPFIARAYLLPLPMLAVSKTGGNMTVSWPSSNTGDFYLEQAATLTTASWVSNAVPVFDNAAGKIACDWSREASPFYWWAVSFGVTSDEWRVTWDWSFNGRNVANSGGLTFGLKGRILARRQN
jgi:hypothetical protein